MRGRVRSASDVCRVALDRLEAVDPCLHAFNTVTREQALDRAAEIDRDLDRWRDRPLVGVPIALKDNLCTKGVRTTASSRMLETYHPALRRDRRLQARRRGRDRSSARPTATSSRWARRTRTRRSVPCTTRGRSIAFPAASSGGSAATVAAGITPLAFGSDTGGSIRQPAAMCGVVGLKPTYGRVSRYGLIAFGSSLDQIGPLARTVHDAAIALGVIAGADPSDATSAPEPVADYAAALTGDIRGTRVGVPSAVARTAASIPRSHARSTRRSAHSLPAAPRSSTSSCRTRSTRRPCTTWWPLPRRARISRAMTAFDMDFARRLKVRPVPTTPRVKTRCAPCTREPASAGSAPK